MQLALRQAQELQEIRKKGKFYQFSLWDLEEKIHIYQHSPNYAGFIVLGPLTQGNVKMVARAKSL